MKFFTFFTAILLLAAQVVAQTDCPTPNATPTLQVASDNGTTVTLSFATPNPGVFTDYIILVSDRNGILLTARNGLSIDYSNIPTTNGYGYYCLTYNQVDFDAAMPSIIPPLGLVCPGVSLSTVNGHYQIIDLLSGIQTNCPSLLGSGDVASLANLLCTLPQALGVSLPFGVTDQIVTATQKVEKPNFALQQQGDMVLLNMLNNNAQTMELKVFDAMGSLQHQRVLQNNTQVYEIDTKGFANGVYFVQINNGQQTQLAKFLK